MGCGTRLGTVVRVGARAVGCAVGWDMRCGMLVWQCTSGRVHGWWMFIAGQCMSGELCGGR